jgi:hypothetical protein
MMPAEPGIVDANVLVYAIDQNAPQHRRSRALLEQARVSSTTLYVTSQILCEFYSIVTNTRRVIACSLACGRDQCDLDASLVPGNPCTAGAGKRSARLDESAGASRSEGCGRF